MKSKELLQSLRTQWEASIAAQSVNCCCPKVSGVGSKELGLRALLSSLVGPLCPPVIQPLHHSLVIH